MLLRMFLALLGATASAASSSTAQNRTLIVCFHQTPGFNTLLPHGEERLRKLRLVDADGRVNSTSVRGVEVLESELEGFEHHMRELMFAGASLGLVFSQGNTLQARARTLHVYPSYKHTLYYARVGVCDIGFAPMTISPDRESCEYCPPATDAAAGRTAAGPPGVLYDGKRVLAPAQVEDRDTCCVDFSFSYFRTGMAVVYRSGCSIFDDNPHVRAACRTATVRALSVHMRLCD